MDGAQAADRGPRVPQPPSVSGAGGHQARLHGARRLLPGASRQPHVASQLLNPEIGRVRTGARRQQFGDPSQQICTPMQSRMNAESQEHCRPVSPSSRTRCRRSGRRARSRPMPSRFPAPADGGEAARPGGKLAPSADCDRIEPGPGDREEGVEGGRHLFAEVGEEIPASPRPPSTRAAPGGCAATARRPPARRQRDVEEASTWYPEAAATGRIKGS
jgi:hypothetical protein